MLRGLVGRAHIVVMWLLQMKCTRFSNGQLSSHLGSSMVPRPQTKVPFLRNGIVCKFSSYFSLMDNTSAVHL